MGAVFDFLMSPFGLPINPIYEYFILGIIGIIAFLLAYRVAGRLGSSPSDRRGLHWFFRIVFFIAMWAVVKLLVWIMSLF